ncbi:MAG TPA: TRAP transporter small permease [Syntrophorhabdaceae bacterium]|nr:TRAP transporter small permease [Syntrophorhabdaceae bacterium]
MEGISRGYLGIIEKLSKALQVVGGVALVFIMLLTVADVILRRFGHPIVGTYEIVGLGGAVVIGFAIPITSWLRGHIFVDFFYQRFSPAGRAVFNITTRVFSLALFVLIGYNLFLYAGELYKSGEVTLTRQLPFYPVAYGLGVCCFIEFLVLIGDVLKIIGGDYE